ncbi:hypothetical protein V6N12_024690 [Hibiscus sabdariffa]|uniref:FLZ-type domain-containing protein n=1 Tax=Hibiscus sabdariffa TaxID=183260 RepID=A0ABR2BFS5_9ROSI
MDSSGRSRRNSFIKEDQGLASLPVMEVGHNQNELSQSPRRYSRSVSLRNISSCSPPPVSARFEVYNQPSFLDACFLCKKPLGANEDIFMYRRDFCSEECRQEQLDMDETDGKSNSLLSSMKARQFPCIKKTERSAKQGEVREDVKPSGKLKTPSTAGDFPTLASVLKITFLCLSDIKYLSSLPPLGQLPVLEHLTIQRVGGVKSIGPEFHKLGLNFRKPFQSLKTLKLEAISLWKRWTPLEVEVEVEEFPCLQELYIINNPKLVGDLPKRLPSLIKLEIYECRHLTALIPWTSGHCVLKLQNCYKVQNRIDCHRMNSTSMQFPPCKVQQDQDENQTKPSAIDDGSKQFSSSTGTLRIERYASNMLPKEILERSSLQKLYLVDCTALKIFPLPRLLKTLFVHNCRALEFPQCYKPMNQLEDLTIGSSCDSLQTFPLNYFPKLVSLRLRDCRNLENLSIENELQNELTSLEFLEIKCCPKLSFFLEDEFQAPNLRSVGFYNCVSLKSVQSILSFESLQTLYIDKCPALESFPTEGLPSGLIALSISFCDKMTPHKGWKSNAKRRMGYMLPSMTCSMISLTSKESFAEFDAFELEENMASVDESD